MTLCEARTWQRKFELNDFKVERYIYGKAQNANQMFNVFGLKITFQALHGEDTVRLIDVDFCNKILKSLIDLRHHL